MDYIPLPYNTPTLVKKATGTKESFGLSILNSNKESRTFTLTDLSTTPIKPIVTVMLRAQQQGTIFNVELLAKKDYVIKSNYTGISIKPIDIPINISPLYKKLAKDETATITITAGALVQPVTLEINTDQSFIKIDKAKISLTNNLITTIEVTKKEDVYDDGIIDFYIPELNARAFINIGPVITGDSGGTVGNILSVNLTDVYKDAKE